MSPPQRDSNGRYAGHGLAERLDDLRRELDQRLTALDERLQQHFDLDEKARSLAYESLEKRLELLNELRADVMPRTEYDVRHEAIALRVQRLEKVVWMSAGAGGFLGVITGIILRVIIK